MNILLFPSVITGCQPVLVFFPGGKTSADMALRFIDIQYFSGLFGKSRVDLHQSVCNVFMYSTLAYSKGLCRLPYRGIVVYPTTATS